MAGDLTGRYAQSLAGHDTGSRYIIVRAEGGFAWAADGRLKKAACPKKKNLKHLRLLPGQLDADRLKDDEIRKALKRFSKEDVNV